MPSRDGFDVLAPRQLTVPPVSSTNKNANKGQIMISGAVLIFFDGTQWRTVTSS